MKRKVLVAEDQTNWHRLLKAMLPVTEYETCILAGAASQEAESLMQEAALALREEDIDLAIINMNLLGDPDVPHDQLGVVLLEFIRDEYPTMPRIVMSGGPGGYFSTYAPLDADEVLIKGHFTAPDLLGAISRAIDRRAARTTLPSASQILPGAEITEEIRKDIEELVKEFKLREALNQLCVVDEHRRDGILLFLRLNRTRQQERLGIITSAQADTKYIQVADAILEIVS